MNSLLFLIICIFFAEATMGQDSIPVVRQYDNDNPITATDSAFHNIPNTIFISLDEGFDDSIYVTVNSIAFLKTYLKTNESIGYAESFGIGFKDSSEIKELKILFVNANRYIKEKLNLNYKSLQVRGLKQWTLIYTNKFPKRE